MFDLQEERPAFVVDNDMKAEWVIAKIRAARKDAERQIEELRRQMEFYAAEIERISDRTEEEVKYFENMVYVYFADRNDAGFCKDTKTQTSYKLPSAKLVLKRQQPGWTHDDNELLGWVRTNAPEYVKITESVDWAELKKTLTQNGEYAVNADGEIVPGVTVTERPDVFKVEVQA